MNELISLKDLKPGQSARVDLLFLPKIIRKRLRDIGLIEGTVVKCIMKSPAGDPVAYDIRGCVIALRLEDLTNIMAFKND